jgi:hypothetical protein
VPTWEELPKTEIPEDAVFVKNADIRYDPNTGQVWFDGEEIDPSDADYPRLKELVILMGLA